MLQRVVDLSRRFAGLDISFRRGGVDWPHPWRVRLVANKNERSDYRITAYGDTLESAVASLEEELSKR